MCLPTQTECESAASCPKLSIYNKQGHYLPVQLSPAFHQSHHSFLALNKYYVHPLF